eukprot:TRINITY_DN3530_c0_g1_i2.p1 TRINITY_DN3530_c0_g1~~TRINITY_DN3530_c0_g1_i2.p1  ORF type:complete len:103 (+),score=6.19 TRINITY_DN3530_c0_g1_i2:225-533(+)
MRCNQLKARKSLQMASSSSSQATYNLSLTVDHNLSCFECRKQAPKLWVCSGCKNELYCKKCCSGHLSLDQIIECFINMLLFQKNSLMQICIKSNPLQFKISA